MQDYKSPVTAALQNAPLDDEPYTDEQRLNDALAEAAIANGEGISHEELLQFLEADNNPEASI